MIVEFNKLPIKTDLNKLKEIHSHALLKGWNIIQIDYHTGMIRFNQGETMINIYSTTLTVTTELIHPKKGKTQLHRKYLGLNQLKNVFNNPRVHTGKGYYKKSKV